jgi:hypothetical protein
VACTSLAARSESSASVRTLCEFAKSDQSLPTGLTVKPRLSAQTLSATVIIKADASDSTNVRIAGASFCKSCLATIAK